MMMTSRDSEVLGIEVLGIEVVGTGDDKELEIEMAGIEDSRVRDSEDGKMRDSEDGKVRDIEDNKVVVVKIEDSKLEIEVLSFQRTAGTFHHISVS